jgi:methylenetetrahydrofolate reductase (NADPH)
MARPINPQDTYRERLIKHIPTETLGTFMVASGLVMTMDKPSIWLLWVVFIICLGLTPLWLIYGMGVKNLVQNILAVHGDEPRELEGFEPHPQSLPYASDLVAFISSHYDFCLGAAGYPESHIDAQSKEKDIDILKLKVDNGAEFIITNYFYDNSYFFDFLGRCQAAGINIPILPGVMPVYSVKMMEMLAGLCGATITDTLRMGLAALPEDDKGALNDFGIDFAAAQCQDLLKAGVVGLHIYTMDRSSSTVGIVNRLRSGGLL